MDTNVSEEQAASVFRDEVNVVSLYRQLCHKGVFFCLLFKNTFSIETVVLNKESVFTRADAVQTKLAFTFQAVLHNMNAHFHENLRT
jgi:hypothetical protein